MLGDCISLKNPIPAFQIKIFDDENECKIEGMNCLEKLKIKHDNLQATQPKKKEKNAIQTSFTETPITYEKSNETVSSETIRKNKYLQEVSENTCFKFQDTENQIEFERSVETSSTPITKTIPEIIYAFKAKKPNLELSNSSKMLLALFGEGNLSNIWQIQKTIEMKQGT